MHTLAEMPQESLDQLPADILVHLLEKREKALLIYGTGHFYGPSSIPGRVSQKYQTAMFLISPYTGFQEKTCSDAFEASTAMWGQSTLVSPVRGTSLAAALSKPGCHVSPPSPGIFSPEITAEQKAQAIAKMEQQQSGVSSDALLYLGPARPLTRSPESSDLYLNLDFRREMVRRAEMMLGRSLKDTHCPHRIACARCDFYIPKESSKAQGIEAKSNLLRLRQEFPLNENELRAGEDGIAGHEKLVAKLVSCPTPALK